MWVTNLGDNTVAKLNADGSVAGTFSVGQSPSNIAFDGKDLWVSNLGANTVTKQALRSRGISEPALLARATDLDDARPRRAARNQGQPHRPARAGHPQASPARS